MTTPASIDTISASNLWGLSLRGRIRTREKCKCGAPFTPVNHSITKDVVDIICKACYDRHGIEVRPHKFYIDARNMGAGKIYRNKQGLKFDSFLAAHRQLEEMRGQQDRKIFDPADWMPSKLREHTLKEMSGRWLKRLEDKSHSYQRHAKTDMEKHIIPVIGESFDVRELRTQHMERIREGLAGKAPKTVKNVLATFQTFCNWLYYLEIIQRLPRIPAIKVPQSPRSWINRETQARIISFIPEHHRLVFETLAETAARPGEVCALKVRDLVDGEILLERAFDERGRVKTRKSGKALYRAVSLALWGKLVARSRDRLPEAWLFVDQQGQPYRRERLYKIWVRACKKAEVRIDLYRGTRTSRASQKRLELEKGHARVIASELGNTEAVALRHYARDRREEKK